MMNAQRPSVAFWLSRRLAYSLTHGLSPSFKVRGPTRRAPLANLFFDQRWQQIAGPLTEPHSRVSGGAADPRAVPRSEFVEKHRP
jgi:hypothetical protein